MLAAARAASAAARRCAPASTALRAAPAAAARLFARPASPPALVRCFAQRAEEPVATEPLGEEPAAASPAPEDAKDARIQELAAELAKAKAEVATLANARVRLLAEMENVRTIAKRDVDIAKNFAVQGFAKRLLDVVDNLHRAVESIPAAARVKRDGGSATDDAFALLYEGVSATERDFLKTLGQFGIEQFGKPGDTFDYNRYDALAQLPAAAGQAPNTVVQVLKAGYSLKERTLRPAQVIVTVAAAQ